MEVTDKLRQQLINEVMEAFETTEIPSHAITVKDMVEQCKEQGAPRSRSTVERLLGAKVESGEWTRAYDGKRYHYWRLDG